MPSPLHQTVATIIEDGAAALARSFSPDVWDVDPTRLITVAHIIRKKYINVQINPALCLREDARAFYDSEGHYEGNTLYLSRAPVRGNIRDMFGIMHEALRMEHALRNIVEPGR